MAITETTKLQLSKIDDDDIASRGLWGLYQRQDADRLEARLTTQYAGDPNTFVAGFWVGQFCYDTTNSKIYVCTTATGVAATSTWTFIEDIQGLGALSLLDTVSTGVIDGEAVTFEKIQDIATQTLIGRFTALSGPAESITLGPTIALSGAGVLSAVVIDVPLTGIEDIASASIVGRYDSGAGPPQLLTLGANISLSAGGELNTVDTRTKVAVLRQEEVNGNNGGASIANVWTTRVLNIEGSDPDAIVVLAANRFTPVAGNYKIIITSSFFATGHTRTRLWNATDTAVVLLSNNVYFAAGDGGALMLIGYFTASGAQGFELQYRTELADANGLGKEDTMAAGIETYTTVMLEKI